MSKHKHYGTGFTIVELLVVIAVIVTLATITVLAIGPWRTRTAETEVKNALVAAASSLSDYKTFNNSYPVGSPPTMPSSYESTASVTMVYISGTASTYCLRATSVAVPTVVRYMTQSTTVPQTTACT